MSFKTTRTLFALSLSLLTVGNPVAAESVIAPSRHTFRAPASGTADQLARTPVAADDAQIVRGQPLKGDARASSTTGSTATSDLIGSSVAAAPLRNAVAAAGPVRQIVGVSRNVTPLVANAAGEAPAQINDRAAVDRNARLVPGYTSYAPTTVSYEEAQRALYADRGAPVVYGNTYGTYSPETYEGRFEYTSYAPRYYYPSSYTTVYYSAAPRYYSSGYYAGYTGGYRPTYSYCRPTYTYCPPVYYRPSYRYQSYCSPRFNTFHYGYHSRGGSSFGFSFGW